MRARGAHLPALEPEVNGPHRLGKSISLDKPIKNNRRLRPSTVRSGGRPKTPVARLVRDSLSVYPANCSVLGSTEQKAGGCCLRQNHRRQDSSGAPVAAGLLSLSTDHGPGSEGSGFGRLDSTHSTLTSSLAFWARVGYGNDLGSTFDKT
jgi:hypothetical protein